MKVATAWRPLSGAGDTSSTSGFLLLEDGVSLLLLEDGVSFIELETSVVTPKDDTIWGLTDTKATTAWRVDGYGDVGNSATATRTTVLGDTRVTVSGDIRITADGSYTPKDDTIWVEA
jgi:hypothetical protein